MEEFGEWLARNRRENNLTQSELARRAGCAKTYISMIERNASHPQGMKKIRPSVELVDAFADALNVGRAEARLKAGYAPPPGAMPSESQFARRIERLFRSVPDDQRPQIEETIFQIAKVVVSQAA